MDWNLFYIVELHQCCLLLSSLEPAVQQGTFSEKMPVTAAFNIDEFLTNLYRVGGSRAEPVAAPDYLQVFYPEYQELVTRSEENRYRELIHALVVEEVHFLQKGLSVNYFVHHRCPLGVSLSPGLVMLLHYLDPVLSMAWNLLESHFLLPVFCEENLSSQVPEFLGAPIDSRSSSLSTQPPSENGNSPSRISDLFEVDFSLYILPTLGCSELRSLDCLDCSLSLSFIGRFV